MALLPLESPPALTPAQRACLADLAGGALRLYDEWAGDGERRRIFFYSREGAQRHAGGTILDLGALGFCDTGASHDDFVITAAGRRWLAATTLPAKADS